ncbi:hypothetical protein [Pseudomonas fragi]|uniref:Uncharacterized protein n=1 Tax=Pseudomonas fragi TaxID=296 RepID=A0A9Q5B4W9_PSEFR|nr:hypothetical protein [Pseudomonas fragi]NNB51687.1 hypothetical protein [Pseudomonas fragi]
MVSFIGERHYVAEAAMTVRFLPATALRDRQLSADSVEKIDLHKKIEHRSVKTPILHVST